MADGNIIQNRGEKLFRAEADEYRSLQVRTQVADVDEALLSVAQIVDRGGRVVFSPGGSYIETVKSRGQTRKGHLECRDGLLCDEAMHPKEPGASFARAGISKPVRPAAQNKQEQEEKYICREAGKDVVRVR